MPCLWVAGAGAQAPRAPHSADGGFGERARLLARGCELARGARLGAQPLDRGLQRGDAFPGRLGARVRARLHRRQFARQPHSLRAAARMGAAAPRPVPGAR